MPAPDLDRQVGEKLLYDPGDLETFASEMKSAGKALPRRVNTDPEDVERDLSKLVLTLIEFLRQLMERQALRRVEAGSPERRRDRTAGSDLHETGSTYGGTEADLRPGRRRLKFQSGSPGRPALTTLSSSETLATPSIASVAAPLNRRPLFSCRSALFATA